MARIHAALRKQGAPPEPFQVGDLVINYEERRVTLAGRTLQLTATEYELLSVLSANVGRVSTHDQLLRRVWRSRSSGNPRLVRAFIKKLRRKLGRRCRQPYLYLHRAPGRVPLVKPDSN